MAFWYLASPYSDPVASIREHRYRKAEAASAWLLRQHIWCHSSIVHCHEMAFRHQMPSDADYWQAYNFAMIDASVGLIALLIPGWKESKGMTSEIAHARSIGKIVRELTESTVPGERLFTTGNLVQ